LLRTERRRGVPSCSSVRFFARGLRKAILNALLSF
jgi:hypothetical protein